MTEAFDNWFAREWMGEERWASLQQQYDEARKYLKNCGKPKNEHERWMIDLNKTIANQCKRQMFPHKHLEALRLKERIQNEIIQTEAKLNYLKQLTVA